LLNRVLKKVVQKLKQKKKKKKKKIILILGFSIYETLGMRCFRSVGAKKKKKKKKMTQDAPLPTKS
jgi:hypothetical protein